MNKKVESVGTNLLGQALPLDGKREIAASTIDRRESSRQLIKKIEHLLKLGSGVTAGYSLTERVNSNGFNPVSMKAHPKFTDSPAMSAIPNNQTTEASESQEAQEAAVARLENTPTPSPDLSLQATPSAAPQLGSSAPRLTR